MSDQVRIRLNWVEILDSHDVDTVGEFRFRFRVSCPDRGIFEETRYPNRGTVEISENPAKNRVATDFILYEGPAEGSLTVEAWGEEVDRLSGNDSLATYSRTIDCRSPAWLGRYEPWDEADDPEAMEDWRLSYDIEELVPASPTEG